MAFKHIDLFAGIGGFSLAARWMGWKTIAFCERDVLEFKPEIVKAMNQTPDGFEESFRKTF